MSATTDSALGLSEERGVRGDGGRPGGEAGAGWGGDGRTHAVVSPRAPSRRARKELGERTLKVVGRSARGSRKDTPKLSGGERLMLPEPRRVEEVPEATTA